MCSVYAWRLGNTLVGQGRWGMVAMCAPGSQCRRHPIKCVLTSGGALQQVATLCTPGHLQNAVMPAPPSTPLLLLLPPTPTLPLTPASPHARARCALPLLPLSSLQVITSEIDDGVNEAFAVVPGK
jgi:hypothetical protein